MVDPFLFGGRVSHCFSQCPHQFTTLPTGQEGSFLHVLADLVVPVVLMTACEQV